jgi:hypothetical protein
MVARVFLRLAAIDQRPLLFQEPPANRVRRGSCKNSYGGEINGQLTGTNEMPSGHAPRKAAARFFNFSEIKGPYSDDSVAQ